MVAADALTRLSTSRTPNRWTISFEGRAASMNARLAFLGIWGEVVRVESGPAHLRIRNPFANTRFVRPFFGRRIRWRIAGPFGAGHGVVRRQHRRSLPAKPDSAARPGLAERAAPGAETRVRLHPQICAAVRCSGRRYAGCEDRLSAAPPSAKAWLYWSGDIYSLGV